MEQILDVARQTSIGCIFELIAKRDAAMGGAAFASLFHPQITQIKNIKKIHPQITQITQIKTR